MKRATFHHAGCGVCVAAEQSVAAALDPTRYQVEVVHLGERKDRLAAIGDARRLLEEGETAPVAAATTPVWRRPLAWLVAAAALVAAATLGAAVALWKSPTPVEQAEARLTIALPSGQELTSYPAITSDGKTIAYTARQGSDERGLARTHVSKVRALPRIGRRC